MPAVGQKMEKKATTSWRLLAFRPSWPVVILVYELNTENKTQAYLPDTIILLCMEKLRLSIQSPDFFVIGNLMGWLTHGETWGEINGVSWESDCAKEIPDAEIGLVDSPIPVLFT